MQAELAQLIYQKWGCRVKAVKGRRKALLLETSRGPLYVKGYASQARAEWVISLSEQLMVKGFTQTVQYVYTKDGLPWLPYNGKYYVAIQPIKGRDAQYDHLYDILLTVGCLGEFHRHARGITGGPAVETSSAPLIDKWEDRAARFASVIQRLKSGRALGGLEKKIVRFSPYILHEAFTALDIAKRSPLAEEFRHSLAEQCVAHRDLASHNFLIGDRTYLIDYDTAMYDTQLVDLVQIMNRTLDQQAWSFDVFARMMEQYQRYVPLTDQQAALAYLLLKYPDNFMREVIGLYEGKAGFASGKTGNYLMMIMKNWRARAHFFQGSRHFFHDGTHTDSSIVV